MSDSFRSLNSSLGVDERVISFLPQFHFRFIQSSVFYSQLLNQIVSIRYILYFCRFCRISQKQKAKKSCHVEEETPNIFPPYEFLHFQIHQCHSTRKICILCHILWFHISIFRYFFPKKISRFSFVAVVCRTSNGDIWYGRIHRWLDHILHFRLATPCDASLSSVRQQ